jgi:hypothetical protein
MAIRSHAPVIDPPANGRFCRFAKPVYPACGAALKRDAKAK